MKTGTRWRLHITIRKDRHEARACCAPRSAPALPACWKTLVLSRWCSIQMGGCGSIASRRPDRYRRAPLSRRWRAHRSSGRAPCRRRGAHRRTARISRTSRNGGEVRGAAPPLSSRSSPSRLCRCGDHGGRPGRGASGRCGEANLGLVDRDGMHGTSYGHEASGSFISTDPLDAAPPYRRQFPR